MHKNMLREFEKSTASRKKDVQNLCKSQMAKTKIK